MSPLATKKGFWRKAGVVGFWLFLVKGLLWLVVPALVAYVASCN